MRLGALGTSNLTTSVRAWFVNFVQGGQYGENLAQGYRDPTLAVEAWAAEEDNYNYKNPNPGDSTGHFTQLVWQNTTTVGCGASYCRNNADNGANGWFLVCEYDPAGNVKGAYKDQVSRTGEKDGDLGVGAAASERHGLKRILGGLAAAYVLLAVCV